MTNSNVRSLIVIGSEIAYELKRIYDDILEVSNEIDAKNGDELKCISGSLMDQIQRISPVDY